MKLPTSQQPPVLPRQTALPPDRPADAAPASREAVVLSARQQLDQLQLANREVTFARIINIINRQGAAPSELLLEIRGESLLAQATIGNTELSAGDLIKVMRAGNELQLMGKLALAQEAGITRALIQRLPWQQSLDSGLAKLLTTLTQGVIPDSSPGQLPSARSPQPLPEAAKQALETLFARFPGSTTLAPGAGTQDNTLQQVKQWITESGLFAESRLAQSPPSVPLDLKLAIGRIITELLASQGHTEATFNRLTPMASPELVQAPLQFPQALSPAPSSASAEPATVGQTLRLLAGMLNRITVNQLHSQILTARSGGDAPAPTSTLLLDLPWLTPQNEPKLAQLRMEQYQDEASSKDPDARRAAISEWRINLAIDLEQAGTLNFEVNLRQQSVSARVWAEKQDTLKQVHEELPLLRRSLTELGLEVTDLECRRGSPSYPTTRLEHRLVDTRA